MVVVVLVDDDDDDDGGGDDDWRRRTNNEDGLSLHSTANVSTKKKDCGLNCTSPLCQI